MTIRVARKKADTYRHGDLRPALIQAGLKLLGEDGVRGLSLRAAAELAGVSHAAPYRHFRDKDELLSAIAEEGFRLLTRRMRDEIEASTSHEVLARLRAAGVGYTAFAVQHPAYFRTIFGDGGCKDGRTPSPTLKAAGEEAYQVLRDLVVEGIDRGRLRRADADQLSLAAWSLVHGYSMLLVDGQLPALLGDDARVQAVGDALLRLLESGIKA